MRPSLLVAASVACLSRVAHAAASSMFEVNMLFPRANTTYAPSPHMPFVFSVRNADRARDLHAVIRIFVESMPWRTESQYHYIYMTNQSTATTDEIQFRYNFTDLFTSENQWSLRWYLHWKSCYDDPSRPDLETHTVYSDDNDVTFSTSKGGEPPNLEAAGGDDASCANNGIALALPAEAKLLAGAIYPWPDSPVTKCFVVESSTTASGACSATIDAAAAASISSAATAEPSPAASSVAGGKSVGAGAAATTAASSSSSVGAAKTASPGESAAAGGAGMGVVGLVAVLGAVGVLMA